MSEQRTPTAVGEVVRAGVWWAYIFALVAMLVGWNPLDRVRRWVVDVVYDEYVAQRAAQLKTMPPELCNVIAHKPHDYQAKNAAAALRADPRGGAAS